MLSIKMNQNNNKKQNKTQTHFCLAWTPIVISGQQQNHNIPFEYTVHIYSIALYHYIRVQLMRDLLLLFFHFHFRLLSEWQSILAAEKCLRCTWHGFTIHTVSARPRRQSNVCSYLHTWLFSFFLFTLNSIVWLCELECLCVCVFGV